MVLIHIALLAVVMLSRARQPAPPKTTSVDVVMFQEKVPEKIPEPNPADTKPLDLPPPPQTTLPPPPGIDDENVIDNDGIHPPTPVATRIKLEKGPHIFRVRYFQGPGPDLALMLAWKKPGATEYGFVPRSLIGRPPPDTLAALQPKE